MTPLYCSRVKERLLWGGTASPRSKRHRSTLGREGTSLKEGRVPRENPFAGLAGKRDAIEARRGAGEEPINDEHCSHFAAYQAAWETVGPRVTRVLEELQEALWPNHELWSEGKNDFGLYSPESSREMIVLWNPESLEPSFSCMPGPKGTTKALLTKSLDESELIATVIDLYPEWH